MVALRSDAYGFFPHYQFFYESGTGAAPVGKVDPWTYYTYKPFIYGAEEATTLDGDQVAVGAPAKKTISYTINADKKLVVSSDLTGKIQSNAAAFISRYATGFKESEKDKNSTWDAREEIWNYNVAATP